MKQVLAILFVLSTGFSFANVIDLNEVEKRKKFKLNRRAQFPAGFNLYAFGPSGLGGVSFDYFVVPKLSLEIGAGARNFDPDLGYFVGARYHVFGNTPLNITPYIGVFTTAEYTGNDIRNYNLYIPVGLQRIKKNRLSWSIEVAYQRNSYDPSRSFYGGGKLGFRF